MPTIRKIEELEIWQLARKINLEVFTLLQTKPLTNNFELKNQMMRSSGSIMDNIAEGFERGSRLEFVQFLSIAKASNGELKSQITRCADQKYLDEDLKLKLFLDIDNVGKKIASFMQYLNKSEFKGQKFLERNNEKQQKSYKKHLLNMDDPTINIKHQTSNIINTAAAAKPLGAYPHARKVGNLLFLSGIGSRRASDNAIPGLELDEHGNILKYDIEAECHSVFANVKAVLEASGSSWDKMIDVTVFLTNMKADFPVYNKIYGAYFAGVEACRTTVEVKSLPTPICIELKVIATIE
jgi:2-aminomuconate deaminase